MTIRERKKAQEVFKETNFVFSKKTTFEKANPEIDTIEFYVKEIGYQGHRQGEVYTYTNKTMREYHNCTVLLCYNGGFSMGDIVRKMVNKKETHSKGTVMCKGYEGSPKGRRKYRDCHNCWQYEVNITYK